MAKTKKKLLTDQVSGQVVGGSAHTAVLLARIQLSTHTVDGHVCVAEGRSK